MDEQEELTVLVNGGGRNNGKFLHSSQQRGEGVTDDYPRRLLAFEEDELQSSSPRREVRLSSSLSFLDPSEIDFAPSADYYEQIHSSIRDGGGAVEGGADTFENLSTPLQIPWISEQQDYGQQQSQQSFYPFALMLHNSAPYIASHSGQTAVFHIPGECVVNGQHKLFSDIALAHLLGMKIVIVVGNRRSKDGESCDVVAVGGDGGGTHATRTTSIECQNTLRPTTSAALRQLEEEAGFLRVEVERKLNRYLKLNGVVSTHGEEGNVVSGSNFYTARHYRQHQLQQQMGGDNGIVGDGDIMDLENSGFVSSVHASGIQHRLDNQDIVLLTTIGVSALGDLVHVNGYHLAACVASSIDAYKLVYLSSTGTVLKTQNSLVQELPLSFAQELAAHHDVKVHNSGYATFDKAHRRLQDPGAVELLLHLAWASWALERGVTRAHIVNPGDGAVLEELFTSKNGVNTCLYHDEEDNDDPLSGEDDEEGYLYNENGDDLFWSCGGSSSPRTPARQRRTSY
jgi:amino-acid N-acetyltransferase